MLQTKSGPRCFLLGSLAFAIPAGVAAQEASEGPTELETIIVEGERTAKPITEIYTGISVIADERIERNAQQDVNTIISTTPNVFVNSPNADPSIRGLQGGGPGGTLSGGLTGALPRMSYVVDGVTRPASVANSSGTSLWDVDQIEVFRGPQSLLRGRSAIAGAIIVDTRDPTFERESAFQLGVEHDEFHGPNLMFNGMFSGAITDNIAGRFTFELAKGNDPRDVISAGPTDWVTEYDNARLRGKLLGEFDTALGGLQVKFTTEHQQGQTPQTRATVNPTQPFGNTDDRILLSPETNARTFDTQTNLVSLDAGLDTGRGTFQSVTSYIDDRYDTVPEQTFPSPFDIKEKIFSQDLLYNFGPEGQVISGEIAGLVGLSYERRNQDNDIITPTIFGPLNYLSSIESDTASIYTDLRYGVTDQITLFGGSRLLYYQDDRQQQSLAPFPLQSGTQNVQMSETKFLPAIGLAYNFDENNVLSASVRAGYNPGGAAVNLFTGQPYDYDSESVTTAEITYRGALSEQDLEFGVTAFYNWYKDIQLFAELTPGRRATLQVVNQDKAESYGMELDARWQANEQLALEVALGLLQTEITQSQSSPQLVGNRFGQDPDVTLSFGAVYAVTERVQLDGRATYWGSSFNDFNNTPGSEVGDYWLVNLGVSSSWGPMEARVYVDNLFDEAGVTRYVSGGTFADVTPPRTFGLTATGRF